MISEAVDARLKSDDTAPSQYGVSIMNTEGWVKSEKDTEFCDEALLCLLEFYEKPLESMGFKGSITDLLEQWHDLIAYTVKYLEPGKSDCRKIWHQRFNSSQSKEWHLVLLLIELIFVLPVFIAKVEHLFSLMNRIKMDGHASLSATRLSSLIRICMEGPNPADFDPISSMQLWENSVKLRRPNQKERKNYKQRAQKEHAKTLIDCKTDSSCSDSESSSNELHV